MDIEIFVDEDGKVYAAVDIQLTRKEAISAANRYFHSAVNRLMCYRSHLNKDGELEILDVDARKNDKPVWVVTRKGKK